MILGFHAPPPRPSPTAQLAAHTCTRLAHALTVGLAVDADDLTLLMRCLLDCRPAIFPRCARCGRPFLDHEYAPLCSESCVVAAEM